MPRREKKMPASAYKVTEEFEQALVKYTGAKYAVAVDSQSSALFLALMREGVTGQDITLPARTYPSVPCAIIHAGGKVWFQPAEDKMLRGAYRLDPTNVWDSALRFTAGMYVPGSHMCLSFTGPYKHLKLGKAGAILTDDYAAYLWFKRARYSGRRECSYHDDNFDQLGWNMYLLPEISARGLMLMAQFYDMKGNPKQNPDIELPYPDLSQYEVYQT
jgi:dTDP-4-amino-4,6-dideoxygalactose transaminase